MMKMESKENKNNESKLTKHDITMLGIRSSLLQASFSYERMQAGGWTWAQIPVWKKIFGNDKKPYLKLWPIIWSLLIPPHH